MRWRALASVLLCSVRQASGGIFLHTLDPDGAFREVRCETLADCLREGVATPAMVLHRSWALEIEAALQRSRGHVAGLNASALLARQAQVRETLRRRVLRAAPPQEPPPLRLVRRYTDEDRGVEVSLILLEAWEGHDVPAAIFAPIGHRSSGSPSPGVLHIPGHLAASWRDPAEQEVMLGLVARGYVVLTFDTLSQGERQQYGRGNDLECGFTCEEDGGFASVGGKCSTAHDHFGKQLWLLGRSAAELFLRDAQRALDLLAAVPGVDPGRLGVVGCSGGGMLTAYLAAVDSRVAAACVACYFSTLGRELEHGTCSYDAEQILWKQVNLGIDKPDLLAARAPQPTLVMLTTHDCFPMSGGRDGWFEASQTFSAHGARENTGLYASEAPGFHGFTSVGLDAMHRMFAGHLRRQEDPPAHDASGEAAPARQPSPLPCQSLRLGPGQLAAGVRRRAGLAPARIAGLVRRLAVAPLGRLRARRRAAAAVRSGGPWLRSLPRASGRASGLEAHLLAAGAAGTPDPRGPHAAGSPIKARFYPGGVEEWRVLPSMRECAATVRVFRRREAEGVASPLVLLVGGDAVLNRGLEPLEEAVLGRLHAMGITAVVAGLCGVGDDHWRGGLWEFAPLLLGRTHVGLHAGEILSLVAWAAASAGVGGRVVLVAHGGAVAAALHAAVRLASDVSAGAAPPLAGLALVQGLCDFAGVVRSTRHTLPWQMQMHGVLEEYDLPDLLASLAGPRGPRALVLEPQDALGRPLARRAAGRAYELARRTFAAARRPLRVVAGPQSVGAVKDALAAFVSSIASERYEKKYAEAVVRPSCWAPARGSAGRSQLRPLPGRAPLQRAGGPAGREPPGRRPRASGPHGHLRHRRSSCRGRLQS